MENKNKVTCTCTARPLPPKSFNQVTIDIQIDFCPLHAAAPALVLELKRAVKMFEACAVHSGTHPEMAKAAMQTAHDTLALVGEAK